MPNKKIELKAKVDELVQMILYVRHVYHYCYYLHVPETQEEVDYLNTSYDRHHFDLIKHTLFRCIVLELAKLFGAGEKYALPTLLSQLASAGYFRSLNFDQSIIAGWQEKIKSNNTSISNILILRNKVYAHRDIPNPEYNDINIDFNSVNKLISLSEEIIFQLYGHIFGIHFELGSPIFERGNFHIIKTLAEAEKRRKENIYKKYIFKKE